MKNKNELNKERLLELIQRFLDGKTSLEEDRSLRNYYESFQESDQWPTELDAELEIKERIFAKVKQKVDLKEPIVRRKPFLKRTAIFKYAALFIGLAGMFYLIRTTDGFSGQGMDIDPLEGNEDAITLKLGNGSMEIVNENEQRQWFDSRGNAIGSQQGNQLQYTANAIEKELVFNELSVPYGKRFDLVLSDGTAITMNAGSSLKYPTQFPSSGERKVFLKGEAYFNVAKNKEMPFIVDAHVMEVQVLGTQFNLSYYAEDASINTVLVEGSVKVKGNSDDGTKETPAILVPGERAQWSKANSKMKVDQVDVELHTAWTQGRLVFRNTPFKNIRKKLERHYNVEIINHNAALDEKTYNASFDIETIEQVMNSFKENYALEFEMTDGKITID